MSVGFGAGVGLVSLDVKDAHSQARKPSNRERGGNP